jgi:hypothetical protein
MDSEKSIEELLKNLGAERQPYPKDLLKSSRAAYLTQVSTVIGGGPFQTGSGQGQAGSPPASAPMTPLMKVILTALVAANVALATYLAVTAYENWDKIQALFGTPAAGETSPAPVENIQEPNPVSSPEITISPEGVVTPEATPEPTSPSNDPGSPGGNAEDNLQVGTPEPDGKDNPGKHLGQTPHTPDDPPGQRDDDDKKKDKKDK